MALYGRPSLVKLCNNSFIAPLRRSLGTQRVPYRGTWPMVKRHSGFRVCRIIPGLSVTVMAGKNVNLYSDGSSNGDETSDGEGKQDNRQVFLCHSGKQKNFVRQLHRDLTNAGVSCFFDEDLQSLPLADKFPLRIFQAIETCRLAVLILSEEFLQSKWPMLELSAFLRNVRSGKNPNLKILPIFYMIEPKYLSQITQEYPQWQALEITPEIRAEWQNDVREVRSINGLKLNKGDNEVSLRDKVVKNVCSLLLLPQPTMLQPPPPQETPKSSKVVHWTRVNPI